PVHSQLPSFPTRRSSDLFIYAAFLQEASTLLQNPTLMKRSEEMTAIGDAWRDFALDISRIYKNRKSGSDVYERLADQLVNLAERDRKSTRLNSSHVKISY